MTRSSPYCLLPGPLCGEIPWALTHHTNQGEHNHKNFIGCSGVLGRHSHKFAFVKGGCFRKHNAQSYLSISFFETRN